MTFLGLNCNNSGRNSEIVPRVPSEYVLHTMSLPLTPRRCLYLQSTYLCIGPLASSCPPLLFPDTSRMPSTLPSGIRDLGGSISLARDFSGGDRKCELSS
ncbi:hypothetical protein MLD38_002890 [Melastoma candidum]|uniref:Uncharacterized protein n=1 Tax=Melastoma candidum TaxID=119954 RepID=A0ACB9S9D3_9MYRT|nr:hypothetical protein MLD38_002890 [Melastoma candidum]